jgi:sugar (pentulose or hexulose) kinase
MALPTFVPGVGPFPKGQGRWSTDPDALSPGERVAVASLYLALVTAESMAAAGAAGPVILEGPFASNALYCAALSSITGAPVAPSGRRTGTTIGAALLATGSLIGRAAAQTPVDRLQHPALAAYVEAWRAAARQG